MAASLLTSSKTSRTGIIAVLGLLIVGVAAFIAVLGFVRGERDRELAQWQLRLGWWAQQSAQATERWLSEQLALTNRLADNDTVRLQLTLLAEADAGTGGGLTADEISYVRNLLQAVSLNAGLRVSDPSRRVPANLPQFAPEGVALFASDGRLVAATSGMPPLTGQATELLKGRAAGDSLIAGLDPLPDGVLRVLLVSPVYRFQAEERPEEETGTIVILRALSREAALDLIDPGTLTAPGSEAGALHLIALSGDRGRLLLTTGAPTSTATTSEITEGSRFSLDNENYFLARAARQAGRFLEVETLEGEPLLLSSSKVEPLPWLAIASVKREAALAASEARLDTLATLFFGGILVATLLILLFWRHGASAKAAALSERTAKALADEQRTRLLLQGASDAMTDELLALDGGGGLLYANAALARRLGVTAEDLRGKTLAAMLGSAIAGELNGLIRRAHDEGQPCDQELVSSEAGKEGGGDERVIRAVAAPVGPLNEAGAAAVKAEPATILVLQDITEPLRSREALAEAQSRLVHALVRIINQRDPFAAEQSAQAAHLASELAEEMELPAEEITAAEQSALLIDLGKIQIPRGILTKETALTPEELKIVRRAIREGAHLVDKAGLPPVVFETLRQLAERLGAEQRPVDLTAESLLTATKIAALAHHFVALASKRGYREGFTLEKALKMVREDGDLRHDDAVVSALSHLYHSRGGKERWHLGVADGGAEDS